MRECAACGGVYGCEECEDHEGDEEYEGMRGMRGMKYKGVGCDVWAKCVTGVLLAWCVMCNRAVIVL